MLPTFEAIKALNEAGVRYVIVGGIAAVMHGVARLTMDIDVVVALDAENARRAVEAIIKAGFVPMVPITAEQFADDNLRQSWIEDKNMVVLNFKHRSDPLQSVDVFVRYPLEFEGMYRNSVTIDGYGIPARICSIDDLIAMKLEAGRVKDLADVRQLEMIRESEA